MRYVLFLAAALGIYAQTGPQTVTFSYSGSQLSILRSSAETPTVAEIYVPTAITVNSVTAQLQIDYANVGDLTVYLFSARGTRSILLNNDCGSLLNINTTFDDTAQSKYSDFCPLEAGRGPFRPDQPLANSKGEISAGYWDLVVQNTKSQNSGLLRSFSLTLTGTPVTQPNFTADAVVNSASLDGGIVAPGELISIYGVALGPQNGVQAGSGNAPTSLGGTTVTFDGQPAPILYSSFYQLNVQAPYTLVPGTTTQIKIQAPGGATSSIGVDVIASVAGLFTAQTNGRDQLLAINQDGTPNSSSKPAAAGSIISFYATGLGAVSPAVAAGRPAPTSPLSNLTGGLGVVIGGLSSAVSFAGLAPGYAGLYQINAQIPPTTLPGARNVFVVAPNGYSSQGRTFIYVK